MPRRATGQASLMAASPQIAGANRRASPSNRRKMLKEELLHERHMLDAAIAEGSDASIIKLHRQHIAALMEEIAEMKQE